jgi:hypothetical protein
MNIRDALYRCRELTAFCSQDGWIDQDSIVFAVEGRTATEVIVSVSFEQVVTEAAGSTSTRVTCFGRLCLSVDEDDEVLGVRPL